jgi:hypothetical protein
MEVRMAGLFLENYVFAGSFIDSVVINSTNTHAYIYLRNGETIEIADPKQVTTLAEHAEREQWISMLEVSEDILETIEPRVLGTVRNAQKFREFVEGLDPEDRESVCVRSFPAENVARVEYDAEHGRFVLKSGLVIERTGKAAARSIKGWAESRLDYLRVMCDGEATVFAPEQIGSCSHWPNIQTSELVLADGTKIRLDGEAASKAWDLARNNI